MSGIIMCCVCILVQFGDNRAEEEDCFFPYDKILFVLRGDANKFECGTEGNILRAVNWAGLKLSRHCLRKAGPTYLLELCTCDKYMYCTEANNADIFDWYLAISTHSLRANS